VKLLPHKKPREHLKVTDAAKPILQHSRTDRSNKKNADVLKSRRKKTEGQSQGEEHESGNRELLSQVNVKKRSDGG